MTCCEHAPRCHTYTTTTRRNDGPCLVRGCGCAGEHEEENMGCLAAQANDTIVCWFDEQSRDANEWQESQLWRQECYWQECPDDEDCYEHDPARRLERAEARLGMVAGLLAAYGEAEGTPVDYEFLVSQISAAITDEQQSLAQAQVWDQGYYDGIADAQKPPSKPLKANPYRKDGA